MSITGSIPVSGTNINADVMELVDVADSKSAAGDSIGVQVPSSAPLKAPALASPVKKRPGIKPPYAVRSAVPHGRV